MTKGPRMRRPPKPKSVRGIGVAEEDVSCVMRGMPVGLRIALNMLENHPKEKAKSQTAGTMTITAPASHLPRPTPGGLVGDSACSFLRPPSLPPMITARQQRRRKAARTKITEGFPRAYLARRSRANKCYQPRCEPPQGERRHGDTELFKIVQERCLEVCLWDIWERQKDPADSDTISP